MPYIYYHIKIVGLVVAWVLPVLFSTVIRASDATEIEVQRGYNYLYDYDFNRADSCIRELNKKYPQDIQVIMLTANFHWWQLISMDTSRTDRIQMMASLIRVEQIINARKTKVLSDMDRFYLVNVHAYRARLDLMDNNYLKAANRLKKSMDEIAGSLQTTTTCKPLILSSGLFNYFIARFKDEYTLSTILRLPKADKEKGLEMIKSGIGSGDPVVEAESLYFLTKIYIETEEKPALAMPYVKQLIQMHPHNVIYHYLYFQTLIGIGDVEKIQAQLKQLHIVSANKKLSKAQMNCYLAHAQKDLIAFYKKEQKKK